MTDTPKPRSREDQIDEPVAWLASDFQSGHILGVAMERSSDLVDRPSCGEINWHPLYTHPDPRLAAKNAEIERLKKRLSQYEIENGSTF